MIRFLFRLLLAGVILGGVRDACAQTVEGLPLEVRVADETKKLEKKKIRNSTQGHGEWQKFENTYRAEMKNTSLEGAIEGIKLRVIPFYIPYDFVNQRVGYETGKFQVKENIVLAANQSLRVEFDPEQYEKGDSVKETTTTITTWHLGQEYAGVVLEIYHNNVLIATRFDGGAGLRRAYDTWIEKPGNAPEKKPVGTIEAGG